MKYEYIPIPKSNKTKRIATCFFFGGIVLFVLGGIKLIPFRLLLQFASIACFTLSIFMVGRFLLRSYAYRIEDMGEGDEFFVDEITRKARFYVCRLELSKLVSVRKHSELSREERSRRHYNYCPDALCDDSYMLEFKDSSYDVTSDVILVRIQPDDKLLSLLNEAVESNSNKGE